MIGSDLFTYDLDQHPLPPPAVKFPVKDPLPGAKVQAAVGHRDHHFAAHHAQLVDAFRFRCASALYSSVRLCNRPPGRRRR